VQGFLKELLPQAKTKTPETLRLLAFPSLTISQVQSDIASSGLLAT
jgi:hypothetical protein